MTTFAHASHPELPLSHYNYALHLLGVLFQAERHELELKELSKKVHGSKQISGTFMRRKINALEAKGLLTKTRLGKSSNSPILTKLTPTGTRLAAQFAKSRKSFAALREALG